MLIVPFLNVGNSIIPLEELPIIPSECFIHEKNKFLPSEGIKKAFLFFFVNFLIITIILLFPGSALGLEKIKLIFLKRFIADNSS